MATVRERERQRQRQRRPHATLVPVESQHSISLFWAHLLLLPSWAGYSKGGPEGRMAGGIISHLGDVPLVFVCLKTAYDLI